MRTKIVQGRTQKHPKKSHFMDAELVRKILKILNFGITIATLMKLITIIYFHEIFKLTEIGAKLTWRKRV